MRPLTVLLSVEDAMEKLLASVHPIDDVETVSLRAACGRILAEDIDSPLDVPPFDRAAMDGYALLAADTPATLDCVEYLYAGTIAKVTVEPGTCSEIATGAPIPPGADAVVMVEQTRKSGPHGQERIEVLRPVKPGQHITRRGADMKTGESVLKKNTPLTPARVGALAAIGRSTATVYRRPRIAVGATGNEVIEPGTPIEPGQIYNINSYSLAALFESLGCEVTLLPLASDDIAIIKQRVEDALDADMIVLSGGSSVGEHDLLQDVFADLGEIVFHGIAIKPGKPTMLARIKNKPVIGMPGYPTSCLSNGYMFLQPAIEKMARKPSSRRTQKKVTLSEPLPSMADKYQLYPVRLVDGQAAAAFKESGVITSMSRADGFVAIPVGVDRLETGEEVEVTLL